MLRFVSRLTNAQLVQKLFLGLHQNPHILYYHMVGLRRPEYYYQEPITPDLFRFQIEWLLKNKFEFVSLSEIGANGADKRQVAITTDDGFVENYTCIAPILSDYGIPATFFLLNNCIDNKDLMWMNKLCVIEGKLGARNTKRRVHEIMIQRKLSLKVRASESFYSQIPMRFKDDVTNEIWVESKLPDLPEFLVMHKPYMNHKQINELLNAGFSIGAHTFSHPVCSRLSFQELEHEIVDAMNDLRQNFRTPVDYFAYPFGIRPGKLAEEEIFRLARARAFLGTKNSDSKLNGNLLWERDKMEQPKAESLFWFSIVPMVRKFFLRPIGISS